jgi:HK97 family phage major capsid protein
MTIFTTTDDVSGLLPADYGDLVVRPVEEQSVALQVSNTIVTTSHEWHVPIITDDASAKWATEGDDLSGTEPVFAELKVTPAKVGNVIAISNELADDSSPEATEQVGRSIGRAIARKIDEAYFGALPVPAPAGLESLTGANAPTEVGGGLAWGNLDPFAIAIGLAEAEGATLKYFVANPADYLTLMQLKRETGSNEPLLGLDATAATKRLLLGVELKSSRFVAPGTVWGIDPQFSNVILRKDVTVETSRERYFETDRTAVKATMRAGFAFTHPKALIKITIGA